jgi:DNA-binding transcriptional MocR family regulator
LASRPFDGLRPALCSPRRQGIEEDIGSGALPAGQKLPPQRDLAYDIGVTIGTVGRAYSLLRERGLVSGEVGRGTYVLEREVGKPQAVVPMIGPTGDGTRWLEAPADKLRFDSTAAPDVGQGAAIADTLAAIMPRNAGRSRQLYAHLSAKLAEAGAEWLGAAASARRPSPSCRRSASMPA